MSSRSEFRRLVLGIHQETTDPASIRFAADFAELLHLELFGLFIEDENMRRLAGLAGAREFQTLTQRWCEIEVASFSQQMELSARAAQRLISKAASRLRLSSNFEIVRASAKGALAVTGASDILAVVEPKYPAGHLAGSFVRLADAALRSSSAVLLVPNRIARTRGTILALAADRDDPSIPAALAIASAAGERLIIVLGQGEAADPMLAHRLAPGAMPYSVVSLAGRPTDDIARMLASLDHERLIVATRGTMVSDDKAAGLASGRRVPVLILEPQERGELASKGEVKE